MDLIVVNIINTIVEAVNTEDLVLNYFYGTEAQVAKTFNDIKTDDQKFPLLALVMPFSEVYGDESGYIPVTFPRIIIATKTDSTQAPPLRYNETFVPVLYPLLNSFIIQLCRSGYTKETSPERLVYEKKDIPGDGPVTERSNNYVDAIELYNLKINLKKNCK